MFKCDTLLKEPRRTVRTQRVLTYVLSTRSPLLCRYGFDYGCIHFVLMSTEHAFDPASPQYTFLEDHLRSVDRSVTPWLVFAGHRPMYIDSTDAEPVSGILAVAKLLRKNIEPLLLVSVSSNVMTMFNMCICTCCTKPMCYRIVRG